MQETAQQDGPKIGKRAKHFERHRFWFGIIILFLDDPVAGGMMLMTNGEYILPT
jgi:hypothetical protein